MRFLAVPLLLLLTTNAWGAPVTTQLVVNGVILPPEALVEETGDEVRVLALPFLRALRGEVAVTGTGLEAIFPHGRLRLTAGSDRYTFGSLSASLPVKVTRRGGDLVVPALAVARAVGARVAPTVRGLEIVGPEQPAAIPSLRASGLPPGLEMLARSQVNGGYLPSGLGGAPAGSGGDPPARFGLPEGLSGQPLPQAPVYERPVINKPVEPEDASQLPPSRRPDPAICELRAERVMSFHLSEYRIHLRVKNLGSRDMTRPFRVQLLARGAGDDRYELLETYHFRSLAAGQEVELEKVASGRDFRSLLAMTVEFRAQVLVEPGQQAATDNDAAETTFRF